MSDSELERFVGDLGKDATLLEYVKTNATGLASLVASAKSHGYDFTIDEAKRYIKARNPGGLSDKQTDGAAGKLRSDVVTSIKAVQTIVAATTAVEAAQAATTVFEAAEAIVVVAAVLV
ncbi:Nif11-like leader peptide family natural product precursor [Rhizobium leguminosarum]|uniref:Nif11-like leader peptide family natural product precursor n=1 Tax=Rhizobium leguminosarum TaxID=384 RepID=UPI00103DF0B1|nr:Nif11-like leader peptide family natural product precursor [Rhizobium leguminosarum]TBZ68920.1 Nif11 family protein [Rhizobium leguminosarum bv. viciae]